MVAFGGVLGSFRRRASTEANGATAAAVAVDEAFLLDAVIHDVDWRAFPHGTEFTRFEAPSGQLALARADDAGELGDDAGGELPIAEGGASHVGQVDQRAQPTPGEVQEVEVRVGGRPPLGDPGGHRPQGRGASGPG